ncbi:MAG: Crp/Fnr family transcriptional regulator [Paludibacteraceae bacterium]|nr:Crp/Fnr family transcriptional regulator [Paludibacteraceae bacterium]
MKTKLHIFDYGMLFDGIVRDEKHTLMLEEVEREYEKGKVIYSEGDKPTELFCLTEGKVKIYKDGMDRKQVVRLVKAGDFFGYRPYFVKENYTLTAVAMTDVRVCVVKLSIIKKIISNNPIIGMNFIRDLSVRLGIIDNRLVSLTQKHTRGRMADALLIIMETFGRDDDTGCLNCVLKREEIANYANMTTANAIRVLASFHDEGVIELVGKKIVILNEQQLRRISALG